MLNLNLSKGVLGIAPKTRRYDLPLEKGQGGGFIKILIALMTFLAMLAMAATFTLSAMTDRWSSGLENKASIEIPAKDIHGALSSPDDMRQISERVFNYIKSHPAVKNVERMSEDDIAALVAPWLGEDLAFDNIPLPGIITVEFKDIEFDIKALESRLKNIAPQAQLDTHESWLNDILQFTGALQFAAFLITIIIGVTAVIAIAGAVQSRMSVYHEELELLHLMGASDSYISKQLQRYILIISLQGAVIGGIIGGFILWIIGWLAGKMEVSLIPEFSLSAFQTAILICLPVVMAILAMITARHTVLRVLTQMP